MMQQPTINGIGRTDSNSPGPLQEGLGYSNDSNESKKIFSWNLYYHACQCAKGAAALLGLGVIGSLGYLAIRGLWKSETSDSALDIVSNSESTIPPTSIVSPAFQTMLVFDNSSKYTDVVSPHFIGEYGIKDKNYGIGHAIYPRGDGGFIVVGTTGYLKSDNPFPVNTQCVVSEISSDGKPIGTFEIGKGDQSHCYFIKPMIDAFGNPSDSYYFIVGRSSDIEKSRESGFILKLELKGNTRKIVWQKSFRTDFDNDNKNLVIQPTKDGGCLILGTDRDNNTDDPSIFAFKIDEGGNETWSRKLSIKDIEKSAQAPQIHSIQLTEDGFVITGSIAHLAGAKDSYYIKQGLFVAQSDEKFHKMAFKIFYGGEKRFYRANDIQSTKKGFIVVGNTFFNGRKSEVFVLTLNKALDLVSAESLGEPHYNLDALSIYPTIEGRFEVVGNIWKGSTYYDKRYFVGPLLFTVNAEGHIIEGSPRSLKNCGNKSQCRGKDSFYYDVKFFPSKGTVIMTGMSTNIDGAKISVAAVNGEGESCEPWEVASQLQIKAYCPVKGAFVKVLTALSDQHLKNYQSEPVKSQFSSTITSPTISSPS